MTNKLPLHLTQIKVASPINKNELQLLSSDCVAFASAGNESVAKNLNKKLLNYKFGKFIPQGAEIFKLNSSYGRYQLKAKNASNWYLAEDLNKIMSAFFKSIYCLISKPKFLNTPDKLIVEILYYITIPDNNIFKWYNFIVNNNNNNLAVTRKKSMKTLLFKNISIKKTFFKLNNINIAKIYLNKFTLFFNFLTSYFNKTIEFNLIRLHKSDYESNILAQLFILILKKKNINIAINKLFNKNNKQINTKLIKATKVTKVTGASESIATISGLYIHIGGRLMREPIIPRLTTKKFEKGAIATGKVNLLDSARITKKNKKGAYTIKIAYAQNIVAA